MKSSPATRLAILLAVLIIASCIGFVLIRWPQFQQERAHVQATRGMIEATRAQATSII